MIIQTEKAPKAIGPYSQAVTFDRLIFTSGQLPLDPETGKIVGTCIEEQTEQSIHNLEAVLEAGGSALSKVLKTTVLLKNMDDFEAMNGVYARHFSGEFPGRSAIQVAKLPMDALVEIEAVAGK
jgi:2-iminobutanoate/2-iminopropanoate deaminase